MRSFYHCRTDRTRRAGNTVILLTASFCAEIAMIAFFVFFFNLFGAMDGSLMNASLIGAATVIVTGLVICFITEEITHKSISSNSRYTYLDIQQKAVVYSRYTGSFRIDGETRVFRELYYIPLKELMSAKIAENGKDLVLTGKMRRYHMFSDNLGYHIKSGDFDFDCWWLNFGGYKETDRVVIPDCFGRPSTIQDAFIAAKERFKAIPPPKKYEFHEADFIRRRPKPRVMPESLNYKRDWK